MSRKPAKHSLLTTWEWHREVCDKRLWDIGQPNKLPYKWEWTFESKEWCTWERTEREVKYGGGIQRGV